MNKTWLWWGALGVWCVAALVVTSDPTSFFAGIIVAGAALVLALVWLVRLIMAVRSGGEVRGQRLSSLGLEAVVGLATVSVCFLEVPQNVRFHLSEPALTAYAKQQLTHPTGSESPLRIGLYNIRTVNATENEVHLDLGPHFFDGVGFSYSIKPLHDQGDTHYEQIHGFWYKRHDLW